MRSCGARKAALQVRVLGSFAVLRHQTRLPLPRSKKTRALLAYLAVTARPHRRDRLLAALVARLEGVPDQALPHARALSLLEPADEAAHATLVRLLRASGRAREAEEQFQRAQRHLEECKVVRTGALRKAAQVPLQTDAGARAADATPSLPRAEQHPGSALHQVQFCRTTDNVRIAYAKVGNGPPLVWAAHWLSHLAFSWQSPVWRHWTEEFAKDHGFVHYDERGTGLSDWDSPEFSVDAFVRDLEAVVDSLGLDRFALMGSSKGGPTAMAYAARHPERVSHLVLYGTFAQGWRIIGDDDDVKAREAVTSLIRQGWARDNPAIRQFMTSHFLPDASLEEMGWFN